MLDKILKVNDCKAIMYFTHRPPAGLYSSEGNVEELIVIMISPLPLEIKTFGGMIERVKAGEEDTLIINLDEVA